MVSFKATLLRYLWFLVIRAVIVLERERSALSRNADIGVECSESPLSAISTSGGVAVSYCSGYALEFMREHLEKTWT